MVLILGNSISVEFEQSFCVLKIQVLSLLMLAMSTTLPGQNCTPQPALLCEDAPIFCLLSDLSGYSCGSLQQTNPVGPTPLCPGGGVPSNVSWWAFVAGSNSVDIEITTLNCSGVLSPGIQAGIYADCNFQNPIACVTDCFQGTRLLSGNTSPCQTYYVFIDGCNGATCDYVVNVIQGANAPNLTRKPEISVNTVACIGEKICATANAPDNCAAEYRWTIDGIDEPSYGQSICTQFAQPGEFNICVQALLGRNDWQCDLSDMACKTITVTIPPTDEKPEESVCYEDRQNLFFLECATPVPNTPGTHRLCCTVTRPNGCEVEVCKNFTIHPRTEPGLEEWFFCDRGTVRLPDGRLVDECGEYEVRLPGANINGCDSSSTIKLVYLDPNIEWTNYRCDDNGFCLTAKIDIPCMDNLPPIRQFWINTQTGDTLRFGRNELCTQIPGEYCFQVAFEWNGNACINKSVCINLPLDPGIEWSGKKEVCANTSALEKLKFSNTEAFDQTMWTLQGGIALDQDDNSLRWTADGTRDTVKICNTAFLGDCAVIDTCVFRTIIPKLQAEFTAYQSGNSIVVISDNRRHATASWNVLGVDYQADTLIIPMSRNRDFEVHYTAFNSCDTVKSNRMLSFRKARAFASPARLPHSPLEAHFSQGNNALQLIFSQDNSYHCALFDINGRVLFQQQIEAFAGHDLLVNLRENLPPGIYYLAVRNLITGELRTRALPHFNN